MKTVFALFCVVLAAAMADLLIPAEHGAGTKKYLHLLTALAVLLLILSPLTAFLRRGGEQALPTAAETPDFEAVFAAALDEAGRAEFEARLRAALVSEFGGEERDFSLSVRYEEGVPVEVRAVLSGRALTVDPRAVEEYLTGLLQIPASVR